MTDTDESIDHHYHNHCTEHGCFIFANDICETCGSTGPCQLPRIQPDRNQRLRLVLPGEQEN